MDFKGTTIVAVKRNGKTVLAGDGQVTGGQSIVMKSNAIKVRRIYDGKVITGFAGSVADAFTLSERFEEMLNKYSGNLMRSAVELAMLWRGDKALRQLEAMMIVADSAEIYIVDGTGNVIEIGSGGNFALAAARALSANTKMSAREIAVEAMRIASEICVFTNGKLTVEEV